MQKLNEKQKLTLKTMFLSNQKNRNYSDLVDIFIPEKIQRDYLICVKINLYLSQGSTFSEAISKLLKNELFQEVGERQIRNIFEQGCEKYKIQKHEI